MLPDFFGSFFLKCPCSYFKYMHVYLTLYRGNLQMMWRKAVRPKAYRVMLRAVKTSCVTKRILIVLYRVMYGIRIHTYGVHNVAELWRKKTNRSAFLHGAWNPKRPLGRQTLPSSGLAERLKWHTWHSTPYPYKYKNKTKIKNKK